MGYNFPWTNLHDLNLDWIMRQLKRIDELQSTVNHFIQQIPTRLSQLINDTGFINVAQAAAAAPVQSVNEHTGDVTITDIMTRRANQATAYPTTSGAWSVATNIFSNLTPASYYGILTIENNGNYQRHIFNNMSGQVFVGWTDNANITEPATWSILSETSKDLYFCEYNVTTNAQIESALAANKIPVLLYSDTLYVFSKRVSTTNHYFCAVHSTSSSSSYYYARCSSNAWTSGSGTLARLASPTFTGTPKAPTASTGSNTTQLATTAFVQQEITANQPTYTNISTGSVSVPSSTGTELESFTLQPGVYLVNYGATFTSNATGYRTLYISTTTSISDAIYSGAIRTNATDGASTWLSGSLLLRVSTATTFYFAATQNSGSSLTVSGNVRYSKLI